MTDKEKEAVQRIIGAINYADERGIVDASVNVYDAETLLSIINRQKAAIEVYLEENDRLKTAFVQVVMDREEAKAEAVKEFKDRLKAKGFMLSTIGFEDDVVRVDAIDETYKEMVGEHKYRKKPVVVEAIQYNGTNLDEIVKFAGKALEYSIYKKFEDEEAYDIKIATLEGKMQVVEGYYIIKGVEGEFYPCRPDIFEKTYEKVGDMR